MNVLPPIQTQSLGAITPGLFEPSAYDLYLELNPTSLVFILVHHKENKVDYLGEYQATEPFEFSNLILLNQVFIKDKILSAGKFNQVLVSTSLADYQVLPNTVEGSIINHSKWTKIEALNESNINIVFEQNTQVLATITTYFPNAQFTHRIIGLIKQLQLKNLPIDDFVLVDFASRKINIVVYKGGNIQLVNSFIYQHPEDIVYYLQLMFVNFQFDQLKNTLLLSGEITRQSMIYMELIKYFDQIQFAKRNKDLFCNVSIADLPSSFYYSITGNIPCAL